jgi:hypothetical protein
MIRKVKTLVFLFCCGWLITGISSCKTGEGCAATEHYEAKVNKDGVLSKKSGRSNLFSKKQRKKMKKRGQ